VLLTFQVLGTASNAAVQKYLNARRCRNCSPPPARRSSPTRRIFRGRWASISYFVEGRIYGQYIIKNHPNAKVGSSIRTTTSVRTI
jgi:hypothetical protein